MRKVTKRILFFFVITAAILSMAQNRTIRNGLTSAPTLRVDSSGISSSTVTDHSPPHIPSALPDSLRPSLLHNDTLTSVNKKKNGLDLQAVINYEASDSMTFIGTKQARLYGQGKVTYQDINLDANFIRMELDSSLVYANGTPDSTGRARIGDPVFKQAADEYKSRTLKYSFVSQKGFITDVISQQGEGYVVGGTTKKMDDKSFFMQGCKYTTCSNHDHPHFYLHITKAKLKPGKDIVAGPAYMVVEDVPLPLALPFAYFPFTAKYSSGIIMPTFGDEMSRGFFARNGGYYFALSDYADLALTGEIYTKGSWGINAASSYRKRYKFSGNFNIGYITTVLGDKGMPDYSKSNDFRLSLTHTQDSKANPNLSLSASVNFSTSSYDRNDMGSIYNPDKFTQNTKSSSVSLSYRIPNSVWSFSSALNLTQRSSDSTISLSFPDLNLTMSRIYPFKRKVVVGTERWYEKISLSYTGTLRNSITEKENRILQASLIKDWKNGMQHNIPISASFNLFKYINITPSVNYTERWYTNRIERDWDTQKSVEKQDTIWGFNRVYNFNASVSASSKLYGFYKPLPFLGEKVEMIRHVFTPSFSFSASPDFGAPLWGFWKQYSYEDKNGNTVTRDYSPYSNGMFGTAPRGKQGVASFSMSNNVEMKIKSKKDTTGIRKISLIDNLSAGISYNFAADSMNWSNISPSMRIKLTKDFTLNLQGTFDTYTYQLDRNGNPVRVNVTRWEKYGAKAFIGRLSSTSTSFSYTFNNDTFKKLFGKKDESSSPTTTDDSSPEEQSIPNPNNPMPAKPSTSSTGGDFDEDGFQKFKFPWSFGVSYSASLGYGTFNKQKLEYDYRITHNLSFNGNVTLGKGWAFNFSSSYDFDQKKIAYMNCNISRDLHCWRMTAGFVPIGPYKSYFFTIAASSSLLQDLKWDKRSSYYDNLEWY